MDIAGHEAVAYYALAMTIAIGVGLGFLSRAIGCAQSDHVTRAEFSLLRDTYEDRHREISDRVERNGNRITRLETKDCCDR
jgi:hypothetical protein